MQITVRQGKRHMEHSPGEAMVKLPEAFPVESHRAYFSQQWDMTAHVKYCQPGQLVRERFGNQGFYPGLVT